MSRTVMLDDAFLDAQATRLIHLARAAIGRRYLLGIAGLPGSGKSTLAQKLLERIEAQTPQLARLIPMDGFHLPNAQLDALGLRPRKGAPHTFDAQSYFDLLSRARDAMATLDFPVYDRALHDPLWTGRDEHRLTTDTRLILTEGNYLLLDTDPWHQVRSLLDEAWWLDVPPEVARRRIIARHQRGGRSLEDAVRHYERSDAENVRLLNGCKAMANVIVKLS